MKLFETDYHKISQEDQIAWNKIKEKEIVYINGKPTKSLKSYYHEYPKAVRKFISLFPNNFIDHCKIINRIAIDIFSIHIGGTPFE